MDTELLVALMVLWLSTTTALVFFFRLFLANEGEAFHPHSVDVEHRHHVFLAVNSRTICKYDCYVKSISTFVAPRGSSSSKQFTVLSCMISVAGFLGTSRWYALGGVSINTATLCFAGFAALLLVAAFELDVVPERYLEDKLVVTGWLIEKLEDKFHIKAPFSTSNIFDSRFRDFIRSSKAIYHLYEEDNYVLQRPKKAIPWIYHGFWPVLHMIGACAYVICIPAAVLLHDHTESKVSWITGTMFLTFCVQSYLSGDFLPVLKPLRGYVLMWNPFLREPHFMIKLKLSLEEYIRQTQQRKMLSKSSKKATLASKKKRTSSKNLSSSNLSQPSSGSSEDMNKKNMTNDASNIDVAITTTTTENGNNFHRFENNSTVDMTHSTQNKMENGSTNSLSCFINNLIPKNDSQEDLLALKASLFIPPLEKQDPAFRQESQKIDRLTLDNFCLRFARKNPKLHIHIFSHIAVMTELLAMMTPSVALGLQWVTALCEGPSLYAVIDLLVMVITCLRSGNCAFTQEQFQHCILRT